MKASIQSKSLFASISFTLFVSLRSPKKLPFISLWVIRKINTQDDLQKNCALALLDSFQKELKLSKVKTEKKNLMSMNLKSKSSFAMCKIFKIKPISQQLTIWVWKYNYTCCCFLHEFTNVNKTHTWISRYEK